MSAPVFGSSVARRAIVVGGLALFVGSVAATACKPKVGGKCQGTESSCADKQHALACRNGTLVEVACAGPLGCVKYQDHANCDTSTSALGETCMGEDDEYACSPDRKQALVCKAGKFELHLECRGKGGCSILGRTVSCDTTIAAKGDPCKSAGSVACSDDQKHMLSCVDGRFALYRYCRGQYGCFMKGETPSCDETLSLAGDPCGLPGQVVCAVDGKNELVCQNGAFMKSLSCKNGCTVTNRPGRAIDCR